VFLTPFSCGGHTYSEDFLLLSDQSSQYSNSQITRLVGNTIRRSGTSLSGACNLFRHTAATSMLENGANLRVIQEQLGHESISTTEVYTHVSKKTLKKENMKSHPAALLPYRPVVDELRGMPPLILTRSITQVRTIILTKYCIYFILINKLAKCTKEI